MCCSLLARFAKGGVVTLVIGLMAGPLFAQWVAVTGVVGSSAQVGFLGPQNVISNNGLVEDPVGSGQYRLLTGSTPWNSGYGDPNDESPQIHFDFGSVKTVQSMHVWNANEPGFTWRGFRDVTIQYSDSSTLWTTVPERVVFQQAPGNSNYFGQLVTFARPITARYIRLTANSTWRSGGNPDIAALGRVRFFEGGSSSSAPPSSIEYPRAAGVINVKEAPYFASGDGFSDDTAKIQQAIWDWEGSDRIIYLPPGTYRLTNTLRFTPNTSQTQNGKFGRDHLHGAGTTSTILRLDSNVLTNPNSPQPVVAYGQHSFWNGQWEQITADWFNCSLANLTIQVGSGNPGAKGVEFYSNNTGVVRNVQILSMDGQGRVGLDLNQHDQNGPLLVKNVNVSGFNFGITSGQTVNSQTFEDVSLLNQSQVAFQNNGQCIAIRKLQTSGMAAPFRNLYGHAAIIDSTFQSPSLSAEPAIINGEFLYARNISASGFSTVIQNNLGAGGSVGASFSGDYVSNGSVLQLFSKGRASLNLKIQETPSLPSILASDWVNARDFKLTTETEDGPAIQRAINSGARVVYFPAGARMVLKSNVLVNNQVELIDGMHARFQVRNDAKLQVIVGATPAVTFRKVINAPIEQVSTRTVVLLDSMTDLQGVSSGPVFLENVVGKFRFANQSVWARQLNTEPEGTKLINEGGRLWILGLKTERGGTLVDTTSGGASEIIGGLCYTTTPGGSAPMFRAVGSDLSVSIGEVAYGVQPFQILVQEVRGSRTRNLTRGQAPFRFSFMTGSALPLFSTGTLSADSQATKVSPTGGGR